jgi:membrane-associated phospholipid phosphatase
MSVVLSAGDFHFLSDVIAGAFLGITLSALVVICGNIGSDPLDAPPATCPNHEAATIDCI